MEPISYIILVLLVWVSVGLGGILGRIAVEELKTSKPYFLFFQKLLFFAIIAIPLYEVLGIPAVVIAAILWLVLWALTKQRSIHHAIFIIFGLWYFVSYLTHTIFTVTLLLVLYGFLTGTLVLMKTKHKRLPQKFVKACPVVTTAFYRLFLQHWLFPVLAILTYFIV